MSLSAWLKGDSPKPSSKRKLDDAESDSNSPAKKFSKKLTQKDFDWYIKIDDKYCCKLCRDAKQNGAYALGHDKTNKTTNHVRHAQSKC